jgi:hypothetical protein
MGSPSTHIPRSHNKDLAHHFTYIDDVVKTGCVASLHVLDKSTSSGGRQVMCGSAFLTLVY